MSLTKNQQQKMKKMPIIESKVRKSKDGKYLVHQTEITTIKPIQYYETILDDAEHVRKTRVR